MRAFTYKRHTRRRARVEWKTVWYTMLLNVEKLRLTAMMIIISSVSLSCVCVGAIAFFTNFILAQEWRFLYSPAFKRDENWVAKSRWFLWEDMDRKLLHFNLHSCRIQGTFAYRNSVFKSVTASKWEERRKKEHEIVRSFSLLFSFVCSIHCFQWFTSWLTFVIF